MASFKVSIRKHILEEAVEIVEAESAEQAKEAVEQWFLTGTDGQLFFEPVEDEVKVEFLVFDEDGEQIA